MGFGKLPLVDRDSFKRLALGALSLIYENNRTIFGKKLSQFRSCYAAKEIFNTDNETVKGIEGYTNKMPNTVCMKTNCDPYVRCLNHNYIFACLGCLLQCLIYSINIP